MYILEKRAIDITVLSTIQSAWSSPSACIKSNWCRIPSAIIIAIGLLILFTFFCCCAQCLSCCCCRPRKARGFGDSDAGSRALLPHSTSYGAHTDLPVMPSYKLDSLKTPKYAVIGDDGSVTTEDPEKRLREDFPSSSPVRETPLHQEGDYTGPDFTTEPLPPAPQDIFASANGAFHDTLLNQHGQDLETASTPYGGTFSGSGANYPPSYRSGASPPGRAGNQTSYARPDLETPALPTQSISSPRGPRAFAGTSRPRRMPDTSRGGFNEGGPFPILGGRGMNTSREQMPFSSFDRPGAGHAAGTRLPSPPRTQYARRAPFGEESMRAESPAPYPTEAESHEFDPFAARRGQF